MSLIDTLKKLNIIRSGSLSGTYKDGKERPIEFMMDNVLNEKTDITKKGGSMKIFKILFLGTISIFVIFFLIGFISGTSEKSTAPEVTPEAKDAATLMLEDIAGNAKIENYSIMEEDILWTTSNMEVDLVGTKSMYAEGMDMSDVKSVLEKEGWKTTSIGFTYVDRTGFEGVGYLAPVTEGYEYKGAMCVLFENIDKIYCGWGPGAVAAE